MKTTKSFLLFIALSLSAINYQCKKASVDSNIDETTVDDISSSTTVGDVASADVSNKVLDGASIEGNANASLRTIDSTTTKGTYKITEDNGVIITITKTQTAAGWTYPVTVKRDFTNATALDADDNLKRGGTMTTVYSGKLRGKNATAGATATTTFDNYKIDSIVLSGKSTLTNVDSITHTIKEEDFKITLASGEELTRNGTLTTKMTSGAETAIRLDDVFEITGEITVSSSNGTTWTTTIAASNPIIRAGICKGGRKPYTGTIILKITKGSNTLNVNVEHGVKSAEKPKGCNPNKPQIKCSLNGVDINKPKPNTIGSKGKFDFNG